MTLLTIPCIYLPGSSPHGQFIAAEELQAHFDAASALNQAHEACESLYQQAALVLDQAHEEAEQIRQQAYQQGQLEAAQTWSVQHQALIEQTLQWHVQQSELETAMVQHLDGRLRALVAAALQEFIGEQHAADLLVQRVQQRLNHFLHEGTLTLHVAAAGHAQIQASLATHPHVRVVGCAALTAAQARLQSPLFTLHIDLDQHLDSLLSRLTPLSSEPARDDDQNRSPEPQADHHPAAAIAHAAQGRHADLPRPVGV
ncbi:flagellar biosynthesis/type III secretory pathway protein FliH [Pseudomonas sp. JAI115]|uniref:hypothetical protein n=1 Tax=Pseudomonas sp. JAI115 TaxID=2723061 RepID=UPI00161C40BC|nr:hypothetical protein [Pseudomonas sp. JAI115]MBB6155187.1 flagellar biosynthesis/type III secretory pathway protein FliH [Pseudomonas sp. JAI115]